MTTESRQLRAPTTRIASGLLAGWIAGQVVGLAGTRLITIAIPWFVLVTTRDAALAGVVVLAQMAPLVLCKALSGPIIDRVGAIRVAVTADLASAPAVAAIPILHAMGRLSVPALLVIVAIEGALRGPGDAAKYSLCPRIAASSGRPLERITGYANTVDRLAGAVGAALGGLVIAAVGAPMALLCSCGTFVGAAGLMRYVVGPRLAPSAAGGPAESAPADSALADPGPSTGRDAVPRTTYLSSLRQGWDYWRRDPVLVAITTMVALTNLLDQAFAVVLVPEWAIRGGHGADLVGALFATLTGAAVLGSLVAAGVGERMPRLATYVVAFLLAGLPRFLVLALGAPLPVLLGVMAMAGFASGFLNPIIGAVVFGRIAPRLVGRVSALNTSLAWSTMPFGGLLGGGLVVAMGVAPALAVAGAAYWVVTLAPVVLPAFRALGAASPPLEADAGETGADAAADGNAAASSTRGAGARRV